MHRRFRKAAPGLKNDEWVCPIVGGNYIDHYHSEGGETQLRNLDGVDWYHSPVPPKNHVCWVQTWGTFSWFKDMYRCACGAYAFPDIPGWGDRNSRKEQNA